jgi:hypothetical protein
VQSSTMQTRPMWTPSPPERASTRLSADGPDRSGPPPRDGNRTDPPEGVPLRRYGSFTNCR